MEVVVVAAAAAAAVRAAARVAVMSEVVKATEMVAAG